MNQDWEDFVNGYYDLETDDKEMVGGEDYAEIKEIVCDSRYTNFCHEVCDNDGNPVYVENDISESNLKSLKDITKVNNLGLKKHKEICKACNVPLC